MIQKPVQKPLPAAPASPPSRRLTVESNELVHTFISGILEEQGLDSSWTSIIAGALEQLGEHSASGEWLPGLKRSRKRQNDARAAEEKQVRERARKERERLRDLKGSKSKASDKSKENEGKDLQVPPVRSEDEIRNLTLKTIHALTSTIPAPTLTPKHLLLTITPYSAALPDNDSDYDIVPASRACSFESNVYSLPFVEDEQGKVGEGGTVICGMDSWDIDNTEVSPRIVGGTFTFRNVTSPTAYGSLATVLRLSVYTYLSLILEQHLLANSHVHLRYPTIPHLSMPHSVTLPSDPVTPLPAKPPSKRKARSNKSSSGIWAFFSKKTEGIIHRVTGASWDDDEDVLPRTTSLDLTSVFSPSRTSWRTRRVSEDNTRPTQPKPGPKPESTIKASHVRATEEEERRFGPFTSAVRRLRARHCVLSTSPQVSFPPPPLIVRLAQREVELEQQQKQEHASSYSSSSSADSSSSFSGSTSSTVTAPPEKPSLRLTGVDKVGLGSVLGWEYGRGRGMVGTRGFIHHQGLTVLYAERLESETRRCGRARWVTFRYWARGEEGDRTLGEMVERMCGPAAEEHCEREGCEALRGKHRVSWTCGGVRVEGMVKEDAGEGEDITMWESCTVCGKSTQREEMDDGTYLFSFAKFLELMMWSPMLASLSICEHTTADNPDLQKFHILRHFAHNNRVLTFTPSSVQNVFEIRVPKLQVMSGSVSKEEKQRAEARRKQENEEDRQALRTEMDDWWKNIQVRLSQLEEYLEKEAAHALHGKDLPPLPMSDDTDLQDDSQPSAQPTRTPSPTRPQPFRATTLPMASPTTVQLPSRPSTPRSKTGQPAAPYPPGLAISARQSCELLAQLRLSFLSREAVLRKQAAETPVSSLNDVRRAFRSTARGAHKRLTAWQQKHAPGAPSQTSSITYNVEPEWWQSTCHAVPGGRVVVREGEWGSVIAFTLTSLDYQRELARLNNTAAALPPPSTTTLPELSSSAPTPSTKALNSAIATPDPDETDASWEESEAWTAVITRREHPREVSALLSLRDVLRHRRSFDSSTLGSRFSGSVSRGIANFTPRSAWAPAQVKVNLEPVDGQVSQFPEAAETIERALEAQVPTHHQVDATSASEAIASVAGTETPSPSGFVEKNIRSGKASSVISFDHINEDGQTTPPAVPPKNSVLSNSPNTSPEHNAVASAATTSSSLSGALSTAMRYFLNTGSPSPSRPSSPVHPAPHHGLLALETPVDDRPHIKYDWTIGKRLRFSCTVYYAKQFDALRKRCGVDDVMLKSLERSANWLAVGGKSRSNFWKTTDDRFIIKTLVNAWNVADLQVLIDLAPSYFRYVDSTASKASVLAKLMGFYTVEIKNLETGTIQARHDLLVMENLFYKQKVTKTFDLKGIQSRRVKISGDGNEQKTLFDGEWIESQERAPRLIQPHSKHILQEAIKADADFLAKSNIMDYSLLLGIDEEHHEIVCGLVDTIGSYTFAKTLEYKAKQNLNSGKGKEVTVVPPVEYHNRFVNAMDSYFLACPDKWTKPLHYNDRTNPHDLASVL